MMTQRKSIHGEWSSHIAFILAAAGSAIGLGNIWKFSYMTGMNGGGAFVLVYLLCVVVIGMPVMMAEVMLGRRGRQNPINTMRMLAEDEGRGRHWQLVGWMGVVAGFLILSYYSVIAGWTMAYAVRSATGVFSGMDKEAVSAVFGSFVGNAEQTLIWHTIFMVMTGMVVSRGVRSGLEQAVRFMMPTLFLMLLMLVGYAMSTGHFAEGLQFLFRPDFEELSAEGVLMAMGQAFFSLSLGMGAIMIYGSYLSHTASIPRTVTSIAFFDATVAILAGLAIFPIVFANGLEPAAGPGLVFETLPIAFGQMPGGAFFGTLFFVLLVFAAWTSSISLMEPAVAWLMENHGLSRVKAAVWVGIVIWIIGIGTVLSFSAWSGKTLFGKTFFDLVDFLTSNIMLPLGGFLMVVFAAWFMSEKACREELALSNGFAYRAWRLLTRYVAPVAVMLVFLNAVGVL